MTTLDSDAVSNAGLKFGARPATAGVPNLYIPELYIDGIRPFNAPIELTFDRHINLFIGPNASGKTTILRILAAGGEISVHGGSDKDLVVEAYHISENYELNGNHPWKIGDEEIVPIYLPAMRPNLPIDASKEGITDSDLLSNHLHWFDISNLEEKLDRLASEADKTEVVRNAIRIAQKCARDICREDFDGVAELAESYEPKAPPFQISVNLGSDRKSRRRHTQQDLEEKTRLEAETLSRQEKGRLRQWVMKRYRSGRHRAAARRDSYPTLEQMCSGAMTTFTWILYVAVRLLEANKYRPGWEDQSAILLIDEIENHLHPDWQRRVIDALRAHFPGAQIFATTHSPFLIAGRAASEVHRLVRGEGGIISAPQTAQNLFGWTADEILRGFMEVENPTDVSTDENRRKLRALREEGPRSDPQSEGQRQRQMRDLREVVNRDMLAGDAFEAQRKEMAGHLAAMLEDMRRSEEDPVEE